MRGACNPCYFSMIVAAHEGLFTLLDSASHLLCNPERGEAFVHELLEFIGMTELRQALDDINAIRSQVARGTQFRGYGPVSIASTGILALAVAAAQVRWGQGSGHDLRLFLLVWIPTAAIAVSV